MAVWFQDGDMGSSLRGPGIAMPKDATAAALRCFAMADASPLNENALK